MTNKQNLVWIPVIGIYFTKYNLCIISYDRWLGFQLLSWIIMLTALALFLVLSTPLIFCAW